MSDKLRRMLAPLFWIALWQLLAVTVGQSLLIASPAEVLITLLRLITEAGFWGSIGFSLARIACGFLLASVLGIVLGVLSFRFAWLRTLTAPLLAVMKATPVASFIIVALIWIPSRGLSVLISFLMVFPIVYLNILEGMHGVDAEIREMAALFRVPLYRRARYIYLPELADHFYAACSAALGLSWKAGIAAEVIGIPTGSLGEKLYEAKVCLNTPELFAWTAVIIAVSVGMEKLVLSLLRRVGKRGGRMP